MIENFDRLHGLPDGFFDINSANIRSLFPNPTLIHLDGKDPCTAMNTPGSRSCKRYSPSTRRICPAPY